MTDRYLIVGLGNPGKKYENTRHNIGFKVIEELARRHGFANAKQERKALAADGIIKDKKVLLARPQTYMNLSGEAVRALADFYRIDFSRLIIIHDDLDLPLGTLRLRNNGSHGGQNGVRSIIQHLGTQNFARIRCGIDRPPGKMNPVDYVLTGFSGDDQIRAQEMVERAANAVESWLTDGIDLAMTRFNGENAAQNKPPDLQEELALLLRAHELAPRDPRPLDKMAGILKRMGRIEEAIQRHLQAADLFEKQNDLGQAIAHRERAASLNPDQPALHQQIAADYLKLSLGKKAINRYLILARHLEAKGEIEGAVRAVEAALALNPQHPKALEFSETLKKLMAE